VKEIAFGGDGDFSWERYDERYNVDLANNLGNLVSRVTAMAVRYRQGRLAPAGAARTRWSVLAIRSPRLPEGDGRTVAARGCGGLRIGLIDGANEFIAATTPWALAKDPSAADRLTQVLFDAAEAIRLAAVLLSRSCRRRPRRSCAESAVLERGSISIAMAAGATKVNACLFRKDHCGRARRQQR
jgi:methionyl-tRNA synthetase